jgi:hypothetical protein
VALDDTPGSPDWWLVQLRERMYRRRRKLDMWWKWYKGPHPLPPGPAKESQAYLDFQKKAETNFCGSVVRASVNRLKVIGITDADGRSDDVTWRRWQQNKMDGKQRQLYRTALALSEAYLIVGPHPTRPRRALVTSHHPRDTIVDWDPQTGERRAALYTWWDQIEQTRNWQVYVGDDLRVLYTQRQGRSVEASDPVEHGMGALPVVPFACRPELDADPEPEFAPGIVIQDRINMGVLNRMTTSRYTAFRQKYVTGHKFARKRRFGIDPASGLEVELPSEVEQPFQFGPGNMLVSEGENTRFGEFAQSDMTGFLRVHEADILDFFVQTDTPAYYRLLQLINIGADTVQALDINHLAKVGEHQDNFGESHEAVDQLMARVEGDERDFDEYEVRWADPRSLNPAVVADAATKKHAIGYPLEIIAEEMGESPQRVKRIVAAAAAETMLKAGAEQAARQPVEQPRQALPQLPDFSLDGV